MTSPILAYTKDELRKLHGYLTRLVQPAGGPALRAEHLVELDGLLGKTAALIATHAGNVERGMKVLEWRIPKELAPTMNEWGFWQSWRKGRTRKELDDRLLALTVAAPSALLHGAKKRRWVRVTRFTSHSKAVDDAAIDAIGGKMPVDTLVRHDVLAADTPTYLVREAHVLKTKSGNAHVLVEVFECAAEQVPDYGPLDAAVEQIVRKRGKLTRAITGET